MALAAFSPRTRDFFAAFGKFEGFERAAPSPPQRVTYLALSPEPQRGGGEREGGQGEPFDKLSSIKKHRVFRLGAFLCIHGNESVCIAPGCTSLKHSSTLGGGCQPLTRVKRNLSSPRGFTNSVDVV